MKDLDEIIKNLNYYIKWAQMNIAESPLPFSFLEDLKYIKDYFLDAKNNNGINPIIPVGTTIWSKEPFKDGVVRDGDIVEYSVGKDEISIWVNFDPEPITAEFPLNEKDKTWFLSKENVDKLK